MGLYDSVTKLSMLRHLLTYPNDHWLHRLNVTANRWVNVVACKASCFLSEANNVTAGCHRCMSAGIIVCIVSALIFMSKTNNVQVIGIMVCLKLTMWPANTIVHTTSASLVKANNVYQTRVSFKIATSTVQSAPVKHEIIFIALQG
jgi:hypothetical protein